jgi:hypothetical protein
MSANLAPFFSYGSYTFDVNSTTFTGFCRDGSVVASGSFDNGTYDETNVRTPWSFSLSRDNQNVSGSYFWYEGDTSNYENKRNIVVQSISDLASWWCQ